MADSNQILAVSENNDYRHCWRASWPFQAPDLSIPSQSVSLSQRRRIGHYTVTPNLPRIESGSFAPATAVAVSTIATTRHRAFIASSICITRLLSPGPLIPATRDPNAASNPSRQPARVAQLLRRTGFGLYRPSRAPGRWRIHVTRSRLRPRRQGPVTDRHICCGCLRWSWCPPSHAVAASSSWYFRTRM